jgi:integrase
MIKMSEQAPVEKPAFTIEAENGLRCPECGSIRLYRDGLRYLTDGSTVQRFLCRDCGYRFSWPRAKRQHRRQNLKSQQTITYSECSSRALALLEQRLEGAMSEVEESEKRAAGATLEPSSIDLKSELLNFAWALKKQGIAPETITNYTSKLKLLAENGANLLEPETVKAVLAKLQKSNVWKHLAVCAYTKFLKMKGLKWEPPTYKTTRRLPFIPTEQELDSLIASCGKKLAAFLQLLKETGMRCGEANRLQWQDVDLERQIITLNRPEKGGNPRLFKISAKLASMLGAMPKKTPYVFGYNTLKSKFRSLHIARKKAAEKLGNPRLLRITFHTFRHWKATMEYHKTKDLLHVAQMLGHKSIDTTTLYIQIEKALFETQNDDFHFATAKTIEEAGKLISCGFEYVCHHEGIMLFRKRK